MDDPYEIAVGTDFEPCREGELINRKYPNFSRWINSNEPIEMDAWYK
jgi:hypothetical protein